MASRLAIVTGASSGIGLGLAQVFAENGFDLILGAEDEAIHKVSQNLARSGPTVVPVQTDLSTSEGCRQLWQTVEETGRKVDAVALNAGISVTGLFAETKLDEEIDLLRLNVEGTTILAKYAVQKLVSQRQGKILLVSSIEAEIVSPRDAVYAASKAYGLSLARTLRYELRRTGVSVTALQPGYTKTNIFERSGLRATQANTNGERGATPYAVAKQGYTALMKNKKRVYAGSFLSRLQGALIHTVPRSFVARVHDRAFTPPPTLGTLSNPQR